MGDSSRRPAVPPEHYSTAYFLREAGGAHLLEEFRRTRGATVYPIFARIADLCGDLTGKTVLDVGCGRGELATLAVLKGARHVVAVDFSPDALALSSETARACLGHRARRVSLCLADAAAVPARRGSVDVAVLSDVVEHLYPWQIKEMYARLREALKPAGRLVVHTWPNRWHTEATYPLVVAFSRLLGVDGPRAPGRRTTRSCTCTSSPHCRSGATSAAPASRSARSGSITSARFPGALLASSTGFSTARLR
jgi:cyclopropane fatty-acyl-phospholipid synthase-like methyltransferase